VLGEQQDEVFGIGGTEEVQLWEEVQHLEVDLGGGGGGGAEQHDFEVV